MKKNLVIISFLFVTVFGVVFANAAVFAQTGYSVTSPDLGVAYPATAGLSNLDPRIMTAQIIRTALGLLGTIFLVIVLYGGFIMMTAGGNEDKVSDAKKWIFSGVIGLAIILSAFGITTFVLNQLTSATL